MNNIVETLNKIANKLDDMQLIKFASRVDDVVRLVMAEEDLNDAEDKAIENRNELENNIENQKTRLKQNENELEYNKTTGRQLAEDAIVDIKLKKQLQDQQENGLPGTTPMVPLNIALQPKKYKTLT